MNHISFHSMKQRLSAFIGSMDLAITLLVMLAVASTIGTFIKQNEPWSDYSLKFGPFWFEVYKLLGLYDVYSAWWFFTVLAFLILSTTLCIKRNSFTFLREMRISNQNRSIDQLRTMRWHNESFGMQQSVDFYTKKLTKSGYKTRLKQGDNIQYLSAVKGRYNRIGYFLTHLGVVVICLGAIYDSAIPTKWKALTGQLVAETRNLPLDEIADSAWINSDNMAFRGSVDIPEGRSANVLFLPWKDGYFVQKLPFHIKVKDFNVEYYPTGQPKAFKSKLEVYDLKKQLRSTATIGVNEPLIVDGIAIYQSSFGDGGSLIDLKIWSLVTEATGSLKIAVHEEEPLDGTRLTLEMDDFRLLNIQGGIDGNKTHNNGPSFRFKLRSPDGQAREYENFMLPIEREGRRFFLSGVRQQLSDPFQYLYIPADKKYSPNRFMHFLHRLRNDNYLRTHFIDESVTDPELRKQQQFVMNLVQVFARSGFTGIQSYLDALPDQTRRQQIETTVLDLLKLSLSSIFIQTLQEHENIFALELSEEDSLFFDDAIFAISVLSYYPDPVFLQLKSFKQIQSSGLQMTRAPGKPIVYIGCIMLILGVFILFYVRRARFWMILKPDYSIFAIEGIKNRLEKQQEFDIIRTWFKNKK